MSAPRATVSTRPRGRPSFRLADRDIYLGKHGSAASKESYRRLIAEWTSNCGSLPASRSETTVTQVMAAYIRYAKTYYVKNGKTTAEYNGIRQALRFLRQLYGRTLASDFGPKSLIAARQAMIDEPLSRSYINSERAPDSKDVHLGGSPGNASSKCGSKLFR